MKRLLPGAVATLLALGMSSPVTLAATTASHSFQMTIQSNGKTISNPYGIAQNDGSSVTTYVPVYYVDQLLTQLGLTVSWNGTLKTWSIQTTRAGLNFSKVPLGMGNTYITVNDTLREKVNTVTQADPASGTPTTYVPIYYLTPLLSAFGITSTWNGNSHTWSLTSSLSTTGGSSNSGSTASGNSGASVATTTSAITTSATAPSSTTTAPANTATPTLATPTIALANVNSSTNINVTGATSGAVVTLYSSDGSVVVSASANSSGTATFYHVDTGTYYVIQSLNGAVSGKSNQVTVSPLSQTNVPAIYADSSNGYWYIVVNNAAPNSSVTLYNTNGNSIATATTNQYGVALFYNVGVDSYYVIVNSASGNIQSNAISVNSQNSGTTTTSPANTSSVSTPSLSVSYNGTNSLVVNGVQPGATVTIYYSTGTAYATLIANSSGTATANNVPSGTYYATQTSSGTVSSNSNEVTVTTTSPPTPILDEYTNNGIYTLTVSNVQSNAIVTLYNSSGTVYTSVTAGTSGTVTINNVASGTYYAVQNVNGVQSPASAQVSTSGTTTTPATPVLSLADNSGVYSLTVSNVEPNATVTLYESSGTVYATLAASSAGTATMTNVASGTYYATQTWNGVSSASSNQVAVIATLPTLLVYTGTVTNGYGTVTVSNAQVGATVGLYNSATGTLYTSPQVINPQTANSSGYAYFTNVVQGRYYVIQTDNGQQSSPAYVTVS